MPDGCVVIRLPGPRLLRVVARSVLLAVALLSLAWLRAADAPARRRAGDACGSAFQAELLLRDLRREGLLAPGARAVWLGADGDCHPPTLRQDDAMRHVSLRELLMTGSGDLSVDFVLDFSYFNEEGGRIGLVDRMLKDGGIVAAPIGSASAFRLPQNYRVVYIRRFTETFVGMKKIVRVGADGIACARTEVEATAALKEGVLAFSSQSADTSHGQLNNFGRKLLLSVITGASAAHAHGGLSKLSRPMIADDLAAVWDADELKPRHA